jgi:DNA mismatch endonuclease, patch repair protein
MVDLLTRERRSWNMSRIKGRDTQPEKAVRSLLHRLGFRFRLHAKGLPGTPDIVLAKFATAIFVQGCFWHRHAHCRFAYMPKTRIEFWQTKFSKTVERDRRAANRLRAAGWRVINVWECELKNQDKLSGRLLTLLCGPKTRNRKSTTPLMNME